MLESARARILRTLGPGDVVLDVGGWADPFERADWVIDLHPYATRGAYGRRGWTDARPANEPERFSERTWVQRDVCDREPFPFADGELDFAICSHTLEDVRDPIWVCAELQRVARAGYVEVPSRLEEQAWGVAGEFAGWNHHRWLVDVGEQSIEFVFKPHSIHADPTRCVPYELWLDLDAQERTQSLWWQGSFRVRERVLADEAETDAYLRDLVSAELSNRGLGPEPKRGAVRARAAALRRRIRARGPIA